MTRPLVPLWIVFAFAPALATVAGADAHVRVFPELPNATARSCSYAKFVVRVPVEKLVATVRVRVAIPRDVTVFGTQPKAGWSVALTMDRGRVASIAWSGKLYPHEFDEFAFLAATPKVPETLNWDADQSYADGSVVHWRGAPGSDAPHSQTVVQANPDGCRPATKK